jgi:hypothetical protein
LDEAWDVSRPAPTEDYRVNEDAGNDVTELPASLAEEVDQLEQDLVHERHLLLGIGLCG